MNITIKIENNSKKGLGFSTDMKKIKRLSIDERMKLTYYLGDLRNQIREDLLK